MLHDASRLSDDDDPAHGARAAKLAQHLQGEFYDLTQPQLSALSYACRWHEAGKVSADPTIGTCWDADRLDLTRVGIPPSTALLSTSTGRGMAPQ